MVSLYASGTQAAIVTNEHFLSSPAEVGVFQLFVDLATLAVGDEVELRVYSKILTGDSAQGILFGTYGGVQPLETQNVLSEPLMNDLAEANALRYSLKQTTGTNRNFKWKLLKA